MTNAWTRMIAAALAMLWLVAPVLAQEKYPSRPIRMIVPYPPGGSTDPTGRAFAAWLTEAWGQQVVVDNRPGAGSTIGHGIAAKATPDGYTILLGTSGGLAVSPALGTKVPYDPVKDFTPIGLGVYTPFLLVVHPGVPARNLSELIALSKSRPEGISFASVGFGTPNHLGGELLKVMAGFKFVHVPYKGGGPAVVDVIAGRAQSLFGGIPYTGPHVKSGRLKAIAIGHPKRMKGWLDVPAIAETLPGFSNTTWFGLLGPAGMPKTVVNRINAEMRKAVADPGFIKQLEAIGLEPASNSPAEFRDMIRNELARWTKVIKEAGISAETAQ
ncbi:MAG: tripartite tricarboxylate transporter substrate binding protein [Betaproteobacteria bacterium]|nr:tripartite tricarboxylate transporter substrate binding protein [Betaproteobacteria bacterium]